jgi:16S rRNA (uracil1498-N3)-methyltransferase
MRIPRTFVDATLASGAHVALSPFAAEHLTRVLRLGDGAEIACFNGDGNDYRCVLRVRGKGQIWVDVGAATAVDSESPLHVSLAQCIARGEKMDWILQKATELGVVRIEPLVSERTEVRMDEERGERRLAHWRRVVQSACEQCGRARVPELLAAQALPSFAADCMTRSVHKFVLDPDAAASFPALDAERAVVLAVGPEGGFSERDLDALRQSGFVGVRLGPRILRTESAGVAALAVLQHLAGDWR